MSKIQGSRVFIALGSNLGDRLAHLRAAREDLQKLSGLEILALSAIYETEPVGIVEQGAFLNAVIEAKTQLSPPELLAALLAIERSRGRVREVPQGPRTLDLDLLFYGSSTLEDEALTLPHPRLHERAFVLRPLLDLAPDFVHPILGQSIAELARGALKGAILKRLEDGDGLWVM